MSDVQAKHYFDMAMDLHEMQRRATEMNTAMSQLYTQMTELGGKSSAWPAALKTQFDTTNKEFDGVRVKFGVPAPAPPAGGGGRGGGGGGGGGGAAPNDLIAKIAATKSLLMAFQDNPSDTVTRQYNDLKVSVPKAILEGNTVLVKAMTLSQALKKADVTLTVPAPIK
jgi:hypothetical protein